MEIIPVNENAIGALMRTIEASKEELIDKGFSPRRPLPYDARRQPLLKLAA